MSEFDKIIKKGNVLVYFYADWCGKCKMLNNEFDKLNDIDIIKIDVDKNRDICKQYGVMSVPTLIYFKNVDEYKITSGFISIEEIQEFIKK
ncbi:MAG: thioredoxin family protein [Bacilli bacterium]|nr:thioredoxin family protein [Bacilli bacterium]